jgi:hypothetical protein
MTLRLGGLLLVIGAVLTFAPWVATAAIGAPLMICGAIMLAVVMERMLDLTGAGLEVSEAAATEPVPSAERAA